MMNETISNNDQKRKKAILAAALKCFLQFGYSKTSMDDVAKEANLSRPLIYLKFKNKEDLFTGLFDYLIEGRYEEAEKVLNTNGTKRDKLLRIYDIFLIDIWEKIIDKPMSAEFYEVCSRLSPKVSEKYKQQQLKCTQAILEDEEVSKIFMLSVAGLKADLPNIATLKKRLAILVEHFIR